MQKNILLIDDDPEDAEIFSAALGEIDLKTNMIYIGDGIASLRRLLESSITTPDVIFLDINMPVINGWDCMRELKNIVEVRNIPVVIYSNRDIKREGIKVVDIGVAALMTKPKEFDRLKEKLTNVLRSLFP